MATPTAPPIFYHDPDARLDYSVSWVDYLQGDETIVDVTWTVPDDLIAEAEHHTNGVAWIWLQSAFVVPEPEDGPARVVQSGARTVGCRITTSEGRVDERSFVLRFMHR